MLNETANIRRQFVSDFFIKKHGTRLLNTQFIINFTYFFILAKKNFKCKRDD